MDSTEIVQVSEKRNCYNFIDSKVSGEARGTGREKE